MGKYKILFEWQKGMLFLNNSLKVADMVPGVPLLKDRELIIGANYKGFVGSLKDVHYYNCAT